MTGPWQLALRRWRTHIQYQWKSIRLVISDWVVALYIVVPPLIFGIIAYVLSWKEPLPEAAIALPYWVWLTPFLAVVLMARLRVWVESADKLFLFQRQSWMRTLVRFGMIESVLKQVVGLTFQMVILLPWLIRGYAISVGVLVTVFVCILSMSWLKALIGNWIHVKFHGWRRTLWGTMHVIGMTMLFVFMLLLLHNVPILLWALSAIVVFSSIPLLRWRVDVRHALDKDVEAEGEHKGKLAQVLLSQAVEQHSGKRRKRPWLFQQSGYWKRLKRNEDDKLGPLAVKTLWRSRNSRLFYLQLIGVGTSAVVISGWNEPVLLAIVMPVVSLIIGYWLHMYWNDLINGEYWYLFRFRTEVFKKAAEHFVDINAGIAGLIWGLASGILIGTWYAWIIGAVAGIVIVPFIGRMVLALRGWSSKQRAEIETIHTDTEKARL